MSTPAPAAKTPSDLLADHFTTVSFRDLPPKLIADAKTLVADYLGVAIAGSQTDSGAIAANPMSETKPTENGGSRAACRRS